MLAPAVLLPHPVGGVLQESVRRNPCAGVSAEGLGRLMASGLVQDAAQVLRCDTSPGMAEACPVILVVPFVGAPLAEVFVAEVDALGHGLV